jgi:hypothetical protein
VVHNQKLWPVTIATVGWLGSVTYSTGAQKNSPR